MDEYQANNGNAEVMRAIGMAKPMTMAENFAHRRQKLEAELADVNAAIAAIEENPGIMKLVDAINRVQRNF